MPLVGKTYYSGEKGLLRSYDHSSGLWTDLTDIAGLDLYDVRVYPSNANKIVIGGETKLYYSNDGGVTLNLAVGDWSSFVPRIYRLSFTTDPDIIYGVGQGGIVKSTDAGVTFNRLTSFTTNSGILCYAVHFISDTVGIASQGGKLYKTTNGGTSWIGLYSNSVIDPANPLDVISAVHLSADQNTIIAVTKRKIFRSTDGGASFIVSFDFSVAPTFVGISPKFTNIAAKGDNTFIISSANSSPYISYNAGASWLPVTTNDFTSDVHPKFGSTLYEVGSGFYSYDDVDANIHRIYEFTPTSPSTFTISISDTYSNASAYAMDSATSSSPCYQLNPCSQTGNAIIVSNDLSSYVDGYVQIDSACYYVTAVLNCENSVNISYTTINAITDCSECVTQPVTYGLRDCSNELPTIYTTEELTPGISTYLGDVVYVEGYPNNCWIVVNLGGLPEALVILDNFNTCEECIAGIPIPVPPTVYQLTNCLDPNQYLFTLNSQFAQAVDQVVKVTEDPDYCFIVTEVAFDDQTMTSLTILENAQGVLQIFEDCECCLPAPEPTPVKYTRVIPKPDRQFYQITQSQCDISSNIKFAEAYYRLFKNLKYGVNSQCDTVDINSVWIKKQLSNLAVINDPTACVITTPVTPVVCPEPTGNPYTPPTTYSFIVGVDGPGSATSLITCNECFDGSTPGYYGFCPQFNLILDYNLLDNINVDANYVFSYNGQCVFTWGSAISAGYNNTLQTYTMTSANIVNAGVSAPSPCDSCQ